MVSNLWLPFRNALHPCSFAPVSPGCRDSSIEQLRLVHNHSAALCGFLGSQRSTKLFVRSQSCLRMTRRHQSSSWIITAALDPELHVVLELASDAELFELSNILYGRSLLSPLLKSVTLGDGSGKVNIGDTRHDYECEGRDVLMERLESRFLFLAADAKATLRGQRPTYRDVLLRVRKKLNVPCSIKISTEDLEAEIFLHLLQQYSSSKSGSFLHSPWKQQKTTYASKAENTRQEPEKLRGYLLAALKLGGEEILSVILKGGSVFTISTLQNMVAKRLGGKLLMETARYQVAKEVLKKGGQVAATKLRSHVAVLAARQGLVGAASRYIALQQTMLLLGPLLWGTFFADVVIRSVGTDYARVVRAIYAFAQIRLLRSYSWTCSGQKFLK